MPYIKLENEEISKRKDDHIELAIASRQSLQDSRFYYEPILSSHPQKLIEVDFEIAGKKLINPLWVSSMTGGTLKAGNINRLLATACAEFGLGMGLGSCRILLENDAFFEDFDVRKYIGNQPLFVNLGIAQVEQLVNDKKIDEINNLIFKLKADGLIVHINPLQEWLQPNGDEISHAPFETLEMLKELIEFPLIVKEVGQGMGPQSIKKLIDLNLEAIDFGAHGGTNFSQLELLRNSVENRESYSAISRIGHNAEEMVDFINNVEKPEGNKTKIIISGGVNDFLDGYYLMKLCKWPSIYAQASPFLKYALAGYDELKNYIERQLKGLAMADSFLTLKK